MLQVHEVGDPSYEPTLGILVHRGDSDLSRVESDVRGILDQVQKFGDTAIRELTLRFEQRNVTSIRIAEWQGRATSPHRRLLEEAAARIERYHARQLQGGFSYEENGIALGMRVRPLRSVGVYAPGGKASYPSTVLMTAIPARVAGVQRIVLASPNPSAEVLTAASIAGVTEVIDVGGAQAIGALAFGTSSVAAVDKIVGPGNIYVACAKRLVYGRVDIDSIAGPSEVLVVADDDANPEWVAADLIAQAEHDEAAYPLLVAMSRSFIARVERALETQLESLPRAQIARASLGANGHAFVARDRSHAATLADRLAPEHLCLAVRDPNAMLANVSAVGAAFLGAYTPETAGDYAAGPSHVLPTGGAARYASPLGVYDFLVRTSVVRYDADSLREQSELLERLAELEGLHGHARAVRVRVNPAK